jgi:hypothetical protein
MDATEGCMLVVAAGNVHNACMRDDKVGLLTCDVEEDDSDARVKSRKGSFGSAEDSRVRMRLSSLSELQEGNAQYSDQAHRNINRGSNERACV